MSIYGNPVMLGGSGGGGGSHPAAFLRYLENSGTQYINTGLLANSDTDISITFHVPDVRFEGDIFGARDAPAGNPGSNAYELIFWNDYYILDFGDIRDDTHSDPAPYEPDTMVTFSIIGKKAYFNETLVNTFTDTFAASVYTQLLFACNRNGNIRISPGTRIYRVTYTRNGVLLKDFIPAIDNNNVAGMWEAVSGQMYYNAGTGNFIVPT